MNDPHLINLNHLRYFLRGRPLRQHAPRRDPHRLPARVVQAGAGARKRPSGSSSSIPKGLQPTADGEVAFSYCRSASSVTCATSAALDLRRKGSAGPLTIGAVHSISTHLLPGYLKAYQDFSKVRIKVVTVRSRAVLKALSEHRIDVGLIAEQRAASSSRGARS